MQRHRGHQPQGSKTPSVIHPVTNIGVMAEDQGTKITEQCEEEEEEVSVCRSLLTIMAGM